MIFQDKSMEAIVAGIKQERADVEQQRENVNDKLKDFYHNRQLLDEYLAEYGFQDEKDNTDLPMMSINITKKVIRKISLTYKNQPDRGLIDDTGKMSEDNTLNDWFAFNERFTIGYKYAERYKNLLGSILHRPHFNAQRQRWYPYIETIFESHFTEDDPLNPYAYSYPIRTILDSNSDVKDQIWIFWSDEFVFEYIPGSDKIKAVENFADDFTNPYKIMPLVEYRNDFPIDVYETVGAIDLVQANQNINIALNNLNLMIHYQAFDQTVIGGVDPAEVKRIKMGTQDPIISPNADTTFNLLGFNPKIVECVEAIKFNMQAIGYTYNLAINWALDYNPASGFSLLVQNIDLEEAREDDIELAKMHEKSMYKVLSNMQDYYKGYNMLDSAEPILPKDAKITVDFDESLSLPIMQSEDIQMKEFKLEHNVITELDLIKAENPDMDDEEALLKYKENKKLNGTLTAAETLREGFEAGGVVIE